VADNLERKEVMTMSDEGLFDKYTVTKNYEETDSNAVYFPLRLDTDEWAREAALYYAYLCHRAKPQLAADLRKKISELTAAAIRGIM